MAKAIGINPRQQSIVDFIHENGGVQVGALAEGFGVTPQTIRRDLNQLYDLELVQRTHGGAVAKDKTVNMGYRARKALMVGQKSAIAQRAATLIPDNASLYINIGTTTERVAQYLLRHKGLLVITNNINVATSLWPARNLEVMVASGTIRHQDGGIVGPSTEEFFRKFRVDYAVIGCSAIDSDGEVLDYDLREVRVAQTIIQCARSVVLVADSMKFQRQAPIRIAGLSHIDHLVTDDGISPEAREMCATSNISLEIVDMPEHESRET